MSTTTTAQPVDQRSVLWLAWPLILSFWMRQLFTFVDTYFAARIGDHAVAGIGLAYPLDEQISRIGPHIQFNRQTYEQQGAGLGLFIAKRLTELLGGRFHIDSKADQGTTVRVSFAMPGI